MSYHCDMIYMGPAIQLDKQEKLVTIKIHSCNNDNCVNSTMRCYTAFCSACGGEILPRSIDNLKQICFYNFVDSLSGEKYNDYLFHPENDVDNIWLPNKKVPEMYVITEEIGERTISLDSNILENMQKQIAVFEKYFEQMFNDMRTFGLKFETIYVIKTYG